MPGEQERRELGAFLRARRARLAPESVGLPAGQRRKTPGLRREELAFLAGISVTWYTWIEQGREVQVSPSVLDSLARVLRLSSQERAYMFALVTPEATVFAEQLAVAPALRRIIDYQGQNPAYVMGPLWDILAWNRAAAALFGDFDLLPLEQRNMVWFTFARPEARRLVVDWPTRARRLLAEFRADCGRSLHDPLFLALLERLRAASPEFAQWWEDREVVARDGGLREFDHPHVGRLALEQTTLLASNQFKVVLHLPVSTADEAALARMCE